MEKEIESRKIAINSLLEFKFNEESKNHWDYKDLIMIQLIRSFIFTNEGYATKATNVEYSKPSKYGKIIEYDELLDNHYFRRDIDHSVISDKELHKPLLIYLMDEAIPNVCEKYNLGEEKEIELLMEVVEGIKSINNILPKKFVVNLEHIIESSERISFLIQTNEIVKLNIANIIIDENIMVNIKKKNHKNHKKSCALL